MINNVNKTTSNTYFSKNSTVIPQDLLLDFDSSGFLRNDKQAHKVKNRLPAPMQRKAGLQMKRSNSRVAPNFNTLIVSKPPPAAVPPGRLRT